MLIYFRFLEMRSILSAFSTPLVLLSLLSVSAQSAEPKLRERSFRPLVPIKAVIQGAEGETRSQSIKITIPPPAIPQDGKVSSPASSLPTEQNTPSPSSSAAEISIPERKNNRESDQAPKEIGASKTPTSHVKETPKASGAPTLSQLRAEAHALAGKKLHYVFGADNPDSGSLDCSSTVQYLLTKVGIKDVPRTSYDQYDWLKRKKLLDDVYGKAAPSKLLKKLSPGDLIFWGGTWNSGHRVSHVMLYMGYDPKADKHYVFGARSRTSTGLTGSGVDIFELDTERGRLIAHGKIPGLLYE